MDQIPAFFFEPAQLAALAERFRAEYAAGQPFPHVAIDDFLPADVANRLADEFPAIDAVDWTYWGPGDTAKTLDKRIEKVGTSEENHFSPFTRLVMLQFNSHTFLRFLETLTGIPNLIPDPSFNGCGLHSTGPGGRLMIHTDINRHPVQDKLHQRLNMIYYVNRDWKDEYGGHFELWDRDVTQCVKRVAPIFNRFLIFDTGRFSYHGHPQPLTCPPDRRRNSLAVYYYVVDRPRDENYKGIHHEVGWVPTTPADRYHYVMVRAKRILRKCVPPIVDEIWKRLKS